MLRVLILSTLFPNSAQPTFGGFVERQANGLAGRDGAEVRVVAPIGLPPAPFSLHPRYRKLTGLPRREDWKGLQVYRPRFPIVPLYGARWTARLMAHVLEPLLREIQRDFPFDVINADFFWPDGPAAMRLARALGVPFSVTARGSDVQYWIKRPAVASQILEAAHASGGLLAVSEALGRAMAGYGMPAERIRTHYTGLDHDRFHPIDRRQAKADLGVEGPLLLTVGALIAGKGQRDAILAMEEIPEATLLLVGDGPDKPTLETLIKERKLEQRVRLLGNVPHSEVAMLMGAADAMVLPSRSEGLANVWVEALACGTPIVTCDVGGAREVIDEPEAGALVPPEPSAIAAALKAILADPPAQAAVRRAAEKFSWEKNSARLFEHLSAVAAGRLS